MTSFPPSSPLFPISALARHSVCVTPPRQGLCALFHPLSLPSCFFPLAGVGVAFDTFRNTEHGTRHRDVAVFVNNGDRSREEVLTGFDGWCACRPSFALLFPLFQLFLSLILRTCGCFHGFHRAERDVSRPFRTYFLPPPRSDASIRYHGERADFSVTNSSRAKLTIEVRPPLL